MPLWDLYRGPTPLAVPGEPPRVVLVRPLLVRELGQLQAVLADAAADPLAGVEALPPETPEAARRRALRAAFEAAEAAASGRGPGGEADAAWLEYLLLLIELATDPTVPPPDAAVLMADLGTTGLRRLRRLALGIDPRQELVELIHGPLEDTHAPPGTDPWAGAVDAVAERLGIGYQQVGEMTLSQFRAACRGGKPEPLRLPRRPAGLSEAQWAEVMRRNYYGEDDPPPEERPEWLDRPWPNDPKK